MNKEVHVSGTRKKARARATLKEGSGIIRINDRLLSNVSPKVAMMRIQEPLILAGDVSKDVDIDVRVHGGGFMSQAEAARLTIARALIKYTKDDKLKSEFISYDRQLMVADVRTKETRKPNRHGKARAKRQKSYR